MFRLRLFLLATLTAIVLAGCGQAAPHRPTTTAAYIPPGSIFGLTDVRAVIESPYDYEAGLLGYQQPPVADSDYMLPYAATEHAALPGGKWDTYFLMATVYVDGSGWIQEWEVGSGPDRGARFAYLHLLTSTVGVPAVLAADPQQIHRAGYPGYDATGQALEWLQQGQPLPAAGAPAVYHGGDRVGWTHWPWWPQYAGGGPGGGGDAHLCLVYSRQAADWFYRVASGLDKAPARFPTRAWTAWTRDHHKNAIPHTYKGHISREAWVWWRVRGIRSACRAPVAREHWHARIRAASMRFQSCILWSWPKAKGDPVHVQKARLLR